jgi:hypothetical protein
MSAHLESSQEAAGSEPFPPAQGYERAGCKSNDGPEPPCRLTPLANPAGERDIVAALTLPWNTILRNALPSGSIKVAVE